MNWIFKLTIRNLFKRKIRTVLTILGISIGIVSLVVLIGVGKGVENEILKEFDAGGSIKKIEVYSKGTSNKYKMITDKRMKEFSEISNVEYAYPILELDTTLEIDKYYAYVTIKGVPRTVLEKLELGNGSLDKLSKNKPDLIFGDYVGYMFFYNDGQKSYSTKDNNKTDKLYKKNASAQIRTGGEVRKDTFRVAATMKIKESYSMDSTSVYCDIEALKRYSKKNGKDGVAITQPVDINGNSPSEWVYSRAVVVVDEIENVDYVVKRLQDMGYETYNEKEQLDMVKRVTNIIRFMFCCIGAIALFVAVIGISNTMTTAVYDRIKEIGLLKMLGCDIDELRMMFVIEAGIIGVFGGIIGCIISYGVDNLINKIVIKVLKFPKGTSFVALEPKVAVGAIVFALVLGVLAGFLPARWASRIKPLEAVNKVD